MLSAFRLVTKSGAVLGGRPDLLYHPAGTVLGGHGGVCRGEVLYYEGHTECFSSFSCYKPWQQIVQLLKKKNAVFFILFELKQIYSFHLWQRKDLIIWTRFLEVPCVCPLQYILQHRTDDCFCLRCYWVFVLFRIWTMWCQVKCWMKTSPLPQCHCPSWQLCWGFLVQWSAALERGSTPSEDHPLQRSTSPM